MVSSGDLPFERGQQTTSNGRFSTYFELFRNPGIEMGLLGTLSRWDPECWLVGTCRTMRSCERRWAWDAMCTEEVLPEVHKLFYEDFSPLLVWWPMLLRLQQVRSVNPKK